MGIAKLRKNQKANKPKPKTESDAKMIGIELSRKEDQKTNKKK